MPRKIRRAPRFVREEDEVTYIAPGAGLKSYQYAVQKGLITPQAAGAAYAGAPRFVRQAGAIRRRAAPGAPTPGAPELAQQYWGGFKTPEQRAQEEQAIAGAGFGAATFRAGAEVAPERAGLDIRGIRQPLDIEQQRAEQELAMGAPTLEAAGIANQLARQRIEEEGLTAPIMRRQ